jgi:sterol desaturase/sphingolipid hydroxylase (fatty acid hydroxylase superfamily)
MGLSVILAAVGIIGFTIFLIIWVLFAFVGGAIALWAVNQFGYFLPFTWAKAFALGFIIAVIGNLIKR